MRMGPLMLHTDCPNGMECPFEAPSRGVGNGYVNRYPCKLQPASTTSQQQTTSCPALKGKQGPGVKKTNSCCTASSTSTKPTNCSQIVESVICYELSAGNNSYNPAHQPSAAYMMTWAPILTTTPANTLHTQLQDCYALQNTACHDPV
eukprot:CAMPEP_0202902668 /NCGR_PEP_ID=MMETSP1392-20130828/16987_1 /ASSEMBLY_ACC=CAM_ASM_000868 /TAXON_ID=225041 /ORGANISM="Chlamydomonas chlamydogama, Strain SAG 11-48b" /LENGTH=147 /DNA_ID=CAMNT_0049589467 /DNA_START=338 /DNA_END=781 /DNA_ORIENTATION=-